MGHRSFSVVSGQMTGGKLCGNCQLRVRGGLRAYVRKVDRQESGRTTVRAATRRRARSGAGTAYALVTSSAVHGLQFCSCGSS